MRPEAGAKREAAEGDQGAPVTGGGFPWVRVRWEKGATLSCGQSLGPELSYLKRLPSFPWQRSPRLSDLALRKFCSLSNPNDKS